MTGSATMVHPTIVFPMGCHGSPRPQLFLLEFAEQLERSFHGISPLHGILFKGSRLLTLFCAVLCFLTPADLSISFPISFLLLTSLTCWLIQNQELIPASGILLFTVPAAQKSIAQTSAGLFLCQYVFCSDVLSLAAVPQPPYLSSIFLHSLTPSLDFILLPTGQYLKGLVFLFLTS